MAKMKKEYLPPEEESEGQEQAPERETIEVSGDTKEQIKLLLKSKQYKGRHYGGGCGDEIGLQDTVSTGSFWFDYTLGGGYRTGTWARFTGDPESGKTSQGLKWAKCWQEKYPKDGFVFVFNAEGRITKELLQRSGLNLHEDKFYILKANDAETIWGLQQDMILNNPGKRRYFFLVDAVDAMERFDDKEKAFSEAQKVMGGAALISLAAKRLSILYSVDGHFLYVANQLRATMNTGYGPTKAPSGGNALRFYSSLIGTMKRGYPDGYIYKDPAVKKVEVEENGMFVSNLLGQFTDVRLEKTPNEKTGQKVTIPIKYGLTGGVWSAYEAMQICVFWGKYTRANSHVSYVIDPDFAEELKSNGITFEEKPRTDRVLRDMFDQNPQLTEFVIKYFRKLIFPA